MILFSIRQDETLRTAAAQYACWECPWVYGYQYPWQCPDAETIG